MTKFDQDRSSLIKLLQVFKKCDGRKEGRKEGRRREGGREGIVSIYDLDVRGISRMRGENGGMVAILRRRRPPADPMNLDRFSSKFYV